MALPSLAPVLCAENLASRIQFPGHTVAGNEELTGFEAFRAATGRRSKYNYWQPVTANNPATYTITFDRVRAFNFWALDRGHNLAGITLTASISSDGFATSQTIWSVAIPAVPGGSLDDPYGCATEEGAWVIRHPVAMGAAVRLSIPAMGSGVVPQIVGLYVGLAWSRNKYDPPLNDESLEPLVQEYESPAGWIGRGAVTPRRSGAIRVRLDDNEEYEVARYHILGHFAAGRPMWIVHDPLQSDRAVLAIAPRGGTLGFPNDYQSWLQRKAESMAWVEHEPLRP